MGLLVRLPAYIATLARAFRDISSDTKSGVDGPCMWSMGDTTPQHR